MAAFVSIMSKISFSFDFSFDASARFADCSIR